MLLHQINQLRRLFFVPEEFNLDEEFEKQDQHCLAAEM